MSHNIEELSGQRNHPGETKPFLVQQAGLAGSDYDFRCSSRPSSVGFRQGKGDGFLKVKDFDMFPYEF